MKYYSEFEGTQYEPFDDSPKRTFAPQKCKMPVGTFGIKFLPTESFDKGTILGIFVDGILCLNKEDATKVFTTRLSEVINKWEEFLKEQ